MHSSTVTVAVLGLEKAPDVQFDESDIEFKYMRGSGPGGQKRNKTETCVVATHKPSGLRVRCDDECSQSTNKKRAVETIRLRLEESASSQSHQQRNDKRKTQVGSGMRSDKVRTVQVQNGRVIQHSSGKSISYADYIKGKIEKLGA